MIDVPFAPFFLSQMLGHHYTASYSCLDELSSMDPDLYKSLSYVKVRKQSIPVCVALLLVFLNIFFTKNCVCVTSYLLSTIGAGLKCT